jgi:cysteine-rich repeat protein
VSALCCSSAPSCGDGVVQRPLKECDDGNSSDSDDCFNTCTWRSVMGEETTLIISLRTPRSHGSFYACYSDISHHFK